MFAEFFQGLRCLLLRQFDAETIDDKFDEFHGFFH